MEEKNLFVGKSNEIEKLDDSFYEELFSLAKKNAFYSNREGNAVDCGEGKIKYFEGHSHQKIDYEEEVNEGEYKKSALITRNKKTDKVELWRRREDNIEDFVPKMKSIKSDLENLSERLPSSE
ncbi:MAG: hypothetical protein ACLFQ8_02560 [Candidatus Aenigmatarchaeota archaeon]